MWERLKKKFKTRKEADEEADFLSIKNREYTYTVKRFGFYFRIYRAKSIEYNK